MCRLNTHSWVGLQRHYLVILFENSFSLVHTFALLNFKVSFSLSLVWGYPVRGNIGTFLGDANPEVGCGYSVIPGGGEEVPGGKSCENKRKLCQHIGRGQLAKSLAVSLSIIGVSSGKFWEHCKLRVSIGFGSFY